MFLKERFEWLVSFVPLTCGVFVEITKHLNVNNSIAIKCC